MILLACWCSLLYVPLARADGWDDFSNNLATDLAPLLSLFGEQITKQYLSESITTLDYFIFAMAPMGIMTAVVSAIRVCGSPSLRAFIGRAQEGAGNAEVELCSSTSRDVCELYNNGGIARVFGRPKILEVVHNPADPNFTETAGIYTFREYLRSENGQKEWECVQEDKQDPEKTGGFDAFAPNLSLNVGIKRQSLLVFRVVALMGFVLQAGVVVFATVATYHLRWDKDGSRPESYACPLVIAGTLMVCSGTFLCAFLVGQSTQELVFRRRNGLPPSTMYWVQPGGQSLGDQIFDPFCYSDGAAHLDEYITSWKNRSDSWTKKSELVVWVAVGVTVSGFVLQFVGLRGVHSAISIAQLGAILAMSVARAALRVQRLKPEDNYLRNYPDEVVGHELDWLALQIGKQIIPGASSSVCEPSRRYFWRFCGSSDLIVPKDHPQPATGEMPNAERLLAYRTRLARLTYAPISQTKVLGSAECFTAGMVEVRESAQKLASAIELATNRVYLRSHEIHNDWKNATSIPWEIVCKVFEGPLMSRIPKTHATSSQGQPGLRLELTRDNQETPWKFKDKLVIEGLLGLWIWSLKSEAEIPDQQSQTILSRASDIPIRRIVTVKNDIAKVDPKVWFGGAMPRLTQGKLYPEAVQEVDANILWKRDRGLDDNYRPLTEELPDDLEGIVRFVGWHATGLPRSQKPDTLDVWSAHVQGSLLAICTQEVFRSFIKSILGIVCDFGRIEIQQKGHNFHLANDLVTDLTNTFTESQLGPREDALLCILSPIISQLSLSFMRGALEAAKRNANHHRIHGRWEEAEAVLKWVWKAEMATIGSHSEAASRALGELYRWALRHDEKQFGCNGIEWLAEKGRSIRSSDGDIIGLLYSDLAEKIRQGTHHGWPDIFVEDILSKAKEGSRYDALLYLTLPIPMSDMDKSELLYTAVTHDWSKVVFALLELGVESEFKDSYDRMALFCAAKNGSIDVLKELIDGGASPNSVDGNQKTPIAYASEMGLENVVEILLRDQRIDPDIKDSDGRTPLQRAAVKGNETIVRMLLDTGKVDPDAKDKDGRTLLQWAAEGGDKTAVRMLLLDTGKVDLEIKDRDGRTPLQLAAKGGHGTVVRMLLDINMVSPDATDINGSTPLHLAAEGGHETVVRMLLDTDKVDPDAKDSDGRTPLQWAAVKGNETIVRMLLDTGKVDPDAKDRDGRTLLQLAAKGGNETAVRMLLLDTGKVDLEIKDRDGRTPLQLAANGGHGTIVRILLDTDKVDPDATDINGSTPLHLAAEGGHEAIIKMLLDTGKVNPNATDNDGLTPLHLAAEGGHETVVRMLLDIGRSA